MRAFLFCRFELPIIVGVLAWVGTYAYLKISHTEAEFWGQLFFTGVFLGVMLFMILRQLADLWFITYGHRVLKNEIAELEKYEEDEEDDKE